MRCGRREGGGSLKSLYVDTYGIDIRYTVCGRGPSQEYVDIPTILCYSPFGSFLKTFAADITREKNSLYSLYRLEVLLVKCWWFNVGDVCILTVLIFA